MKQFNQNSFLLLLVIFTFYSIQDLYAQNTNHNVTPNFPITLKAEIKGEQIGQFLEYIEDKNGELTFLQIEENQDQHGQSLDWQQSEKSVPGFGFTNSVYWFRWKTENTLNYPVRYYVEATYPVLDDMRLFHRKNDGKIYERHSGDLLPFAARDLNYRNVVFTLEQDQNSQTTHYLRVSTSSTFIVPLLLWTPKEFVENVIGEEAVLGVFYGIMIVMFIYNLFILLSVRDISYLYYVGYILFWSLFLLTFNGFGFQYLWPNSVWWANNCLNIFAFTTLCFMQLFTISFLDSKTHIPYLHRFLIGMLVLSIAGVIASALIPYRIGIKLVSLHAILTVVTILTAGVRTQIKGYKPARFFLLAWSVMLIGLLILTLRNFAILPDNSLTRWSSQFGSALEVVVLAFALADRINTLKAERVQLERAAFETKLRLLHAFARFVPNEFLEILGKASVEDISHGDSIEKPMAVLFTDIRNFTTISETMDSADNFKFLNSYLKQMGPVIIKNHGFIDKFIGDAIMALFPRDPVDAIQCAIEMRQKLVEFNQHRKTKGYQDYREIEMGIGIHYGNVMLGTVGSEVRLETTVIGDTVNLASRLEDLNKMYHTNILISGDLYDTIKDKITIRVREIDRVYVKGRTHVSRIFEIYEADSEVVIQAKEEHSDIFHRAYQLFLDGEFIEAEKEFQKYQLLSPLDSVGSVHLLRCKRLIDQNPES